MEGWLIWILLAPLLGFLINVFTGSRIGRRGVGLIACGAVAVSFLLSVGAFRALLAAGEGGVLTQRLYTWIKAGALSVDFTLRVDPLSGLMILVVTGVGLLIHIYSVGYMAKDPGYARYFAYLNLFTFSMLLLVLGSNLLLLFVGWEGVGLCSYLLIGFWFERKSAARAGKKAFIVNRIGDFGFIVGLSLLFWSLGRSGVWTLDFTTIAANMEKLGPETITAIALLLFVGAVGKSAQIPLYVWLPDAMEGPTP
ncbi:MAG: NADH-quinone oxidoreductase subunit L, partial [Deltaproteobacteria bacterium]